MRRLMTRVLWPLGAAGLLLSCMTGSDGDLAGRSDSPTVDPTVVVEQDAESTATVAPPSGDAALVYRIESVNHRGGVDCENDESRCVSMDFRYPVIESAANPAAQNALHAFIDQQMLGALWTEPENPPASVEDVANAFVEGSDTSPSPLPWYLERSLSIVHCTSDLVTMQRTEFAFTGGAHGSKFATLHVFAQETGEPVRLPDLLADGYDARLTAAGEAAFREVREIAPNASLEAEGFWFEENQFHLNDNFGVVDDGLVFTFNDYEVAPYVAGQTSFTIAWSEINQLVASGGPLDGPRGSANCTNTER